MTKLLTVPLLALGVAGIVYISKDSLIRVNPETSQITDSPLFTKSPTLVKTPVPKVTLPSPPSQKILSTGYHIFQTFNNCGPAALSMALAHYDLNISQETLGRELRPYQNPQGINDDKSVTLDEIAEKSKEYGFVPIHRPNGKIDEIKYFIANNMPVITRTWLKPNEDIGHFRVIKGYDESRGIIIQDDSLQGKDLEYSYSDFNAVWDKFNYEYLVLVPKEKEEIVKAILKENFDEREAWETAVKVTQQKISQNPADIYAKFNLSVAYFHIGEYEKSVNAYEEVDEKLPFRTLWYQIEPIEAYFNLKRYADVLSISEKILNNHNKAYTELYILRGDVFKSQGKVSEAKAEYEKAVFYNESSKVAKERLNSL